MTFVQVQSRILSRIREKVNNGEITERGFARATGISQPHIHKVLKGTRTLSFERFDSILKHLKFSLLDFSSDAELDDQLAKRVSRPPGTLISFLERPIGPGGGWDSRVRRDDRYAIPCSAVETGHLLVAARLRPDPAMIQSQSGLNVAAIELGRATHPFPSDTLYVIALRGEAVLRRIRQGAGHLYLVSDPTANEPLRWERLAPDHAQSAGPILGRVVWLGRESENDSRWNSATA